MSSPLMSEVKGALKNIHKRIEFWLLWLIFGILFDEWLKQGYFFNPSDIFSVGITHEKLVLTVLILYISFKVWKKIKKANTIDMLGEKLAVPWQNILTTFTVTLIIVSVTVLAAYGVAPWQDVFTIYLIVLAGLGFITTGFYYGKAKAYEQVFYTIFETTEAKEAFKKAVEAERYEIERVGTSEETA